MLVNQVAKGLFVKSEQFFCQLIETARGLLP